MLQAYLTRYVATLTQNVKIDHLALTVIDCLAFWRAATIYLDPKGRELPDRLSIIMNAMREAEHVANPKKHQEVPI